MKRNTLLSGLALASLVTVSACGSQADEPAPAPATEEAAPAAEAPAAEDAAEAVMEAASYADLTADAAAGERVFALCRSCHVLDEGVNRVGPSLHQIVGRTAGTVEGFNYTDANSNSGIVWSEEELFTYLKDPQAAIPGTRMAFPGIADDQQRADLVAYLAAQ
jgi:cytochrome c